MNNSGWFAAPVEQWASANIQPWLDCATQHVVNTKPCFCQNTSRWKLINQPAAASTCYFLLHSRPSGLYPHHCVNKKVGLSRPICLLLFLSLCSLLSLASFCLKWLMAMCDLLVVHTIHNTFLAWSIQQFFGGAFSFFLSWFLVDCIDIEICRATSHTNTTVVSNNIL